MPAPRNRPVVPAALLGGGPLTRLSILLALPWLLSSAAPIEVSRQGLLILDLQGQPVEGAQVQVWPPFEEREVLEAMAPPFFRGESGAGGEVALQPPSRSGFLLVVDHPRFEPYWSELDPALWRAGVRLASGRTWQGHLEGTQGLRIEGRICASWVQPLERWQLRVPWERCAPVSTSGAFELQGLGPEPTKVRAEVPGCLVTEVTIDARSPAPGLRLEAGQPLRGKVLTAAGRRPIPGAVVGAAGSASARAEADGRFEIVVRGLPATLRLSSPGFRSRELAVGPEQRDREIAALLEQGESLSFSLADPAARPLTKAEVGIELADSGQSWTSWTVPATAQPDGRFSVDLPRPGEYRLRISAEGLLPRRLASFSVAAAEARDLGNLVVEPGAAIRGRVVDSVTNEPVAGAEVAWMPMGLRLLRTLQDQRWPRTLADAEGRFSLAGLAGGRATVTLRSTGHANRRLGVVLGRDEVQDLGTVWVDRGTALRVRVRAESGELLSGLRIEVSEAELGLLAPSATAHPDAQGEARLPGLAPGRYRVQVVAEHPVLVEEVEVPTGVGEHWVDLVLPSRSRRGVVLESTRPVSGGSATLTSLPEPGGDLGRTQVVFEGRRQAKFTQGTTPQVFRSAVTSEGRFHFAAVPPAMYTFAYEDEAGSSTRRRVHVSAEPSSEIEVTIDGRDLKGRVIDHRTAEPIAASLKARGAKGSQLAEASADANGWFTLERLPEEALALEVSAPGYESRLLPLEDPTGPEILREITLDQAAAGEVLVRLVDEEGGAGASALVTLLGEGGGLVGSLPADREGARSFAGVPAGRYFVVVSDPGAGLVVSDRLELSGGKSLRVELELGVGAKVTLGCEADRCGSAPIELLSIRREEGPELTPFLPALRQALRLAPDGRLHAGFLGPGTYRFELRANGEDYSATLRVDSTEPSLVRLR